MTEWELVAVKRGWCPEWLYTLYSNLPPWFQPFKWLFNRRVEQKGRDDV